jgi:phage-related protein (TIGR01555 family)
MYQTFPIIDSKITPEQITHFSKCVKSTDVVRKLRTAAKWGRLFGGAAGILVIEGHDDLMQPLELDDIEVGSFKGIIPMDRWSGIIPGPVINSDINDPFGFGLPTYYNCIMDAGNVNIHHSRILRFTGRELPQWETQVELYWGMSDVELIFDELRKRDYSTWNIVSLLTRAQVLSIEEPQLATLMSGAGGTNKAFTAFTQRMESISQLLNNQGLLVLGKDGKLNSCSYSFGGISDIYHEFQKDLSAAAEMPYEIIFGREAGQGSGSITNNNGSSLQIYDNLIEQKRTAEATPIIDRLMPMLAMSTWGFVPDDLAYHWAPIRAISHKERYDLGKSIVESVLMAYNADLITKKEARKELAQQSGTNGMFSNITPQAISRTPDMYASEIAIKQAQEAQMNMNGEGPDSDEVDEQGRKKTPGTRKGEQVPIEAKPLGVRGLRYHTSARTSELTKPKTNGGSKTSTKSLKQGLEHSQKHVSKKAKGVK